MVTETLGVQWSWKKRTVEFVKGETRCIEDCFWMHELLACSPPINGKKAKDRNRLKIKRACARTVMW